MSDYMEFDQILSNYMEFAFVYVLIHCFVGPASLGTLTSWLPLQ